MKVIKHLKDYWVLYIIGIILIVALVIIIQNPTSTPDEIIRLQEENKYIKKNNDVLLRRIDSLKSEKIKLDTSVKTILFRDSILKVNLDSLEDKLYKIKSLYEKVKSRPNNYNSDSLLKYFSDI